MKMINPFNKYALSVTLGVVGAEITSLIPSEAGTWDTQISIDAPGGIPTAIATKGSDVFVSAAGAIYKWNQTTSWADLGGETKAYAKAIAIDGNFLYAGGNIQYPDATWSDTGVSRFNLIAGTWEPVGGGTGPTSIEAIAVGGGFVYIGGRGWPWTLANGSTANCLGRFDLSAGISNPAGWDNMGGGIDDWNFPGGSDAGVYALSLFMQSYNCGETTGTMHRLHIGGQFEKTVGSVKARSIVRWDKATCAGATAS